MGTATGPRTLLVHTQQPYLALQAARQRQQTAEFQASYHRRAGIEGTISQAIRTGDGRRSRSIGLTKTHVLHLLLAAARNFLRVAEWLAERPHAQTRRSAFAALNAASA